MQLKMVSIAVISPMKNILLVLEALKECVEEIEFNIYGPVKDEEYWDVCRQEIKRLPQNIKVNYHREIEPQKISDALKDAHVFVLPSKSENFGHSIYEALSAGRPVITSKNTPWNNLQGSKAGINVSLEDNDELFKAIQFFAAMDEDELLPWNRGASDYAEKIVEVEEIKSQYRRMFSRVGMLKQPEPQ
jgi:glycosyltransferase involved in cell wall biosynthesis